MKTVDSLLLEIFHDIQLFNGKINTKDKRILSSLGHQLTQGNFLTESQSKLLLKILKENISHIKSQKLDIDEILETPVWSKSFRVIQRVRKIYENFKENTLVIEFTFDKRLKEKLISLTTKLDGTIVNDGSRHYSVSLTERNIFSIVTLFKTDNFEISEKILNFYQEISKIREEQKDLFSILTTSNENLKKIVEEDIGEISKNNLLLLQDRKFRYQYKISERIKENSLTSDIAQRPGTHIFIDSNKILLDDLIQSLIELDRLPVMVIFEGHDSKLNRESLEILAKSLKKHNLDNQVGIYFRFEKVSDTAKFNSAIAEYNFNKVLSDDTAVVGISNSKIPKFMIKMQWKPQTVISFTNNFKNNKSYVYTNDVDLIVYYNNKKPLHGVVHDIM